MLAWEAVDTDSISGVVLSLCVFSVIGGIALWLNGSDKMKQTLKLCLSALTLSMVFSAAGKIELKNEFDFENKNNIDSSFSDGDIADYAGGAVCSICRNILSYVCEDEPDIYYDSDVLTVVLSQKDSPKAEQVKEILNNTVRPDVRVVTENIQ